MEKTTKIVEVDDTPFSICIEEENEDKIVKVKNVKIVCGKYLCSKKEFECEMDAIDYINSKPWDLIISMFIILKKGDEKWVKM